MVIDKSLLYDTQVIGLTDTNLWNESKQCKYILGNKYSAMKWAEKLI